MRNYNEFNVLLFAWETSNILTHKTQTHLIESNAFHFCHDFTCIRVNEQIQSWPSLLYFKLFNILTLARKIKSYSLCRLRMRMTIFFAFLFIAQIH